MHQGGERARIPLMQESYDLFLAFDLEHNMQTQQFLSLNINYKEMQIGLSFFIRKVAEL